MIKAFSHLGICTSELLLAIVLPVSESVVAMSILGVCTSGILASWFVCRDFIVRDHDGDYSSFVSQFNR